MLFEFRFRPFILLPTLTDDVRAAAKALTTSEDNKHLLEDAVAAYRVATLYYITKSKKTSRPQIALTAVCGLDLSSA